MREAMTGVLGKCCQYHTLVGKWIMWNEEWE